MSTHEPKVCRTLSYYVGVDVSRNRGILHSVSPDDLSTVFMVLFLNVSFILVFILMDLVLIGLI